MNTEIILRELIAVNGNVTNDILHDLIDAHAEDRDRMVKLYERYKASDQGVPVLTREFEDTNKVNNKMNNDFFSEIIDTKCGYFMGKPVNYTADKEKPNFEQINAVISDFSVRNSIDDLDAETAKFASICGYGARLCYIDRDGLERVMNVKPWECIFIADRSINDPQYAMRYYTIKVKGVSGLWEDRYRVEWYDGTAITYYVEDGNGVFVLDTTEPVNPQVHLFDGIPLIAFVNNEEQQGDAEKVLSLIDGYDITMSDVNSELEQLRLAYMAFYGYSPDADTMDLAKRTGAFGLDIDGKIEFITKNINDTVIENHLNRLEDNILRFAKSVNFSDEAFGGNITGVAQRYKLLALESKCITAERKFSAALRQMFKILCSTWNKKGFGVDYLDIWFGFKRNIPVDVLSEAQSTMQLKGMVSESTRLSLLSFVDDVEWEMEQMKQDNENMVNLDIPVEEEEEEVNGE